MSKETYRTALTHSYTAYSASCPYRTRSLCLDCQDSEQNTKEDRFLAVYNKCKHEIEQRYLAKLTFAYILLNFYFVHAMCYKHTELLC